MKDGLYHVYGLAVANGELERTYVGGFAIEGGLFHVVEDHVGWISTLASEGQPLDAKHEYRLTHLSERSSHIEVVSQEDIDNGVRNDLLPVANFGGIPGPQAGGVEFEQPARRDSVFEYQDHRMTEPAELRFDRGRLLLNGRLLGKDEVDTVMAGIRARTATLRHSKLVPSTADSLKKAEALFAGLAKTEGGSSLHPKAAQAAVHPEVGTLLGFNRHPKDGGVWVHVNSHDVQSTKLHHGKNAASGQVAALAATLVEHAKGGKVFHLRNDRFAVCLPDKGKAFDFVRKVSDAIADLPPIGGTHRHSASIGLGVDSTQAEVSANSANDMRKLARYSPGRGKTHVHSLLPGLEGHIPVGDRPLALPPQSPQGTPQPQ